MEPAPAPEQPPARDRWCRVAVFAYCDEPAPALLRAVEAPLGEAGRAVLEFRRVEGLAHLEPPGLAALVAVAARRAMEDRAPRGVLEAWMRASFLAAMFAVRGAPRMGELLGELLPGADIRTGPLAPETNAFLQGYRSYTGLVATDFAGGLNLNLVNSTNLGVLASSFGGFYAESVGPRDPGDPDAWADSPLFGPDHALEPPRARCGEARVVAFEATPSPTPAGERPVLRLELRVCRVERGDGVSVGLADAGEPSALTVFSGWPAIGVCRDGGVRAAAAPAPGCDDNPPAAVGRPDAPPAAVGRALGLHPHAEARYSRLLARGTSSSEDSSDSDSDTDD